MKKLFFFVNHLVLEVNDLFFIKLKSKFNFITSPKYP